MNQFKVSDPSMALSEKNWKMRIRNVSIGIWKYLLENQLVALGRRQRVFFALICVEFFQKIKIHMNNEYCFSQNW